MDNFQSIFLIGKLAGSILVLWNFVLIIKGLRTNDKDIPVNFPEKISVAWYVWVLLSSLLTMMECDTKNLFYVIVLLIFVNISAYTDYYTQNLYTGISLIIGGVGWCFLLFSQVFGVMEMLFIVTVCIFPEAVRCFKRGDTWLLIATYPYVALILGDIMFEAHILCFMLLVLLGLILSVVANLKKLWRDRKTQVAYAPYHLIAVVIFCLLMA